MPPGEAAAAGAWSGRLRRITGWPGAAALLAVLALLAYGAASRKSVTFDEVPHLTAGYTYWAYDDYRLHPENGNLPQRWVALPVYLGDFRFPALESPDWPGSAVYELGHRFLFGVGNDPGRMLRRGRAMTLLLTLALGAAVYAWSRHLFGRVGGFVSVVLCAFNPHVLAHGALMTSDVAAALFFLVALAAITRLLERLTPGRLLASAAAVSGLLLAKMSGVLILPMAAILVAVRLARRRDLAVDLPGRTRVIRSRPRQLGALAVAALVHVLVAWMAIWAFHGLRYSAFRANLTSEDRFEAGVTNLLGTGNLLGRAVDLAESRHLLPEAYLYGFSYAVDQSQRRLSFLAGERGTEGWVGFFPYAFAVKTSEALLLVLVLAAGAALAGGRRIRGEGPGPPLPARLVDGLVRSAPLWTLLAVYWLFALRTHLNIGHRHLLPTYPAMFVLAGAAGAWASARARGMRVLLAGALLLVAATSLAVWPDYLAYFNLVSGGPSNGYRHLVDSSLDWGQDLPALRRLLDEEVVEGTPVYLSYFGTSDPAHHGIDAMRLPGVFDLGREKALFPLHGGVYAVSASMLQLYGAPEVRPWDAAQEARYQELRARAEPILAARPGGVPYRGGDAAEYDRYRLGRLLEHLRRREPDAHAGHSILIFRLSDAEVEEALEGPPPG